MKNNITINFKLINDKWTFEICNGDYRYVAGAKDLKDAENKAFERVNLISNVGIVHTTYNPGKNIVKPTMTYEEELVSSGFVNKKKDEFNVDEVW